ncbi:MAG: dap4 3 [Verrucomicrobiales bacterium]|nr:dap4 3 [Verrucomicrobiales bacterium]
MFHYSVVYLHISGRIIPAKMMICHRHPLLLTLLLWSSAYAGFAQGSAADYQRARHLREQFGNKVFRDSVRPHWLPGNNQFWYDVKTGPTTREFILVDAERGEHRPAFDHGRLIAALERVGIKNAGELPLQSLILKAPEKMILFQVNNKSWQCSLESYDLQQSGELLPVSNALSQNVPRASTQTGAETSLHFINLTKSETLLYWVDENGERHGYGKLDAGQQKQQHTYAGHVWVVTDQAGTTLARFQAQEEPGRAEINEQNGNQVEKAKPEPRRRKAASALTSPDGKWQAVIRNDNVFLRNAETKEETSLTTSGSKENAFGEQVFWSPDSRKLVVLQTEPGQEHKVYLVESSPTNQVQPRLHTIDYRKPGDRLPISKPHLFDVASSKEIPVSDDLFKNPWSTGEFRWESDSTHFTFLYNQRGHQVLRVVSLDATNGGATAIIDEQSSTFISYSGKFFYHPIESTGEIIWMSERDGWNHLYLFDGKTGQVKSQITQGSWVVREVDKVDPQTRQIWFRASGIYPGQDPYYVHYARVNFDGTGLVFFTEGNGTHTVQYSPDRRFIVDSWSRVDHGPVNELRRVDDGKLVFPLETAEWSALTMANWKTPEPFVAKGRDGKTDIYGVIYRPTNFSPDKQYPVIENIYAGPHGSFVPKAFSIVNAMQELAELGFVVVQIDGMGTANRSKAFHDVCCKNLVDAGFPDRILWIKAAANRYPYMDLSRVGIYGTSAGGQSALAGLLTHADFYKAGVADCGCHDNRMDKIWWNEQWMGWPVGPHYAEQSNVTLAKHLQGKLLLMWGELDKNVDPASTMQVVNALIKADKDFELLVVPGAGHGVAGSPYGRRRLEDFFVRHLLKVEPRWKS